ncbi:MAG: hypothetical protein K2Q45_00455 [Nitrosomonas sp.]|nr:hypothetical protein [Nitrosomonas sp.]
MVAVLDTTSLFHSPLLKHWQAEEESFKKTANYIPDRFQQLTDKLKQRATRTGDALVARVRDVFNNGFGTKWGDDQIRVSNAFLASCLPLIYGDSWQAEKTRVLKEWKLNSVPMYSLVNMARRNGKTYVTSGVAAALFLCVPNIKIAIFSTCRRTSQMLMTCCLEFIERAFERGTHVQREDYNLVTKNTETVLYEFKGAKQQLGR